MEKALIALAKKIKLEDEQLKSAFKWDLTKVYLRVAVIPGAMAVLGIAAFVASLDNAIAAGIWAANTILNTKFVLTEYLQYRKIMKELQ